MGGLSTSLIITGVINLIIGIWTGNAIEFDSGPYFFCISNMGGFIGDFLKYDCTNLFLFNTLPAFFLITGIIARITGR